MRFASVLIAGISLSISSCGPKTSTTLVFPNGFSGMFHIYQGNIASTYDAKSHALILHVPDDGALTVSFSDYKLFGDLSRCHYQFASGISIPFAGAFGNSAPKPCVVMERATVTEQSANGEREIWELSR